jgi:hypothetical protein
VRVAKTLVIVACLLALQGCAAAALSVAGIAGGAGFQHFINGIVDQTFSSPIAGTRLATLKALKRMGMSVEKDEKSEDGWTIVAKAVERKIDIDLEELSEKSVQMRVDVHRNEFIFLKDPSTGQQIIEQTRVELSHLSFKRSRIATVQMMLSELGYDTKSADGVLGPKTKRAILRFQRRNAIRADGKMSSQLVTKIQKKRDVRKAARKKARIDKGWQ